MAQTVKAAFSTPMLHVADIERSLRFYALLGFELVDMEENDAWEEQRAEPLNVKPR